MKNHIKLYEEFTSSEIKEEFYTNEKDVKAWIRKNNFKNVKVDHFLQVSFGSNVTIGVTGSYIAILGDFPVFITEVKGNMDINNQPYLKSLKRGPSYVKGNFWISDCPILEDLGDRTTKVGGWFSVTDAESLSTLEGSPDEVGSYKVARCPNIKTLKGISRVIHKDLDVYDNGLLTLLHATKFVNTYSGNPCFRIYQDLDYDGQNWQDLALHAKALTLLGESYDSDVENILLDLKRTNTAKYEGLISHEPSLAILTGDRGEDLKQAYDVSKNVEGDFY